MKHACAFAPEASASVVRSETVELDDYEAPAPTAPRLLLRPGESDRLTSLADALDHRPLRVSKER